MTSLNPIHPDYDPDKTRKIFEELFFEIANRLQALEGKQPITKQQLRSWVKSKLNS